jgi:hypothetical protein
VSAGVTRAWVIAAALALSFGLAYLLSASGSASSPPRLTAAERLVVTAPPLRSVAALPTAHRPRVQRHRHAPRPHRAALTARRMTVTRARPAVAAPVRTDPTTTMPAARRAPAPRPAPTAAPRFDSSGGFDSTR